MIVLENPKRKSTRQIVSGNLSSAISLDAKHPNVFIIMSPSREKINKYFVNNCKIKKSQMEV